MAKKVVASAIRPQADLVFCVDVTESMRPCVSGVLANFDRLVTGLTAEDTEVDFRLRLLAYRDLTDKDPWPWVARPFTTSADLFRRWLGEVKIAGGGDEKESTLDAIYRALRPADFYPGMDAEWRPYPTHRTIVVLTDADTHPLHPSTCQTADSTARMVQELQTFKRGLLYLVAPPSDVYARLEESMRTAERTCIWDQLPRDPGERQKRLAGSDWGEFLQRLGDKVSESSADGFGG